MARTPRASVSQTSGQGISRASYQKGYALAHQGDAPSVKSPGLGQSSTREYAKAGPTNMISKPMNISYGDTYKPSDLEDVRSAFNAPPPKGFDLRPRKANQLK